MDCGLKAIESAPYDERIHVDILPAYQDDCMGLQKARKPPSAMASGLYDERFYKELD
jgi:hypothetical protein